MSRASTPPASRDERGAAVPLVVGLAVVLGLLAGVLVAGGHLVVERRRAAAGADLAALAGAVARQHNRDACTDAAEVVALNDVELVSCEVAGEEVRVTTAVTVVVLGREVAVRARAHAGPVSG